MHLSETEYAKVGLAFALALQEKRNDDAYEMLALSFKADHSAASLAKDYELMIGSEGHVTDIEVLDGWRKFKHQPENVIGTAYVSIGGYIGEPIFSDSWAITVVVCKDGEVAKISEVQWGRP